LTVAAISHVFTISRVAEMLGENVDWLHELSIDMFPEDGCLHIVEAGGETITAFTDFGIECLQDLIRESKR
jgi:hypothetical protein